MFSNSKQSDGSSSNKISLGFGFAFAFENSWSSRSVDIRSIGGSSTTEGFFLINPLFDRAKELLLRCTSDEEYKGGNRVDKDILNRICSNFTSVIFGGKVGRSLS